MRTRWLQVAAMLVLAVGLLGCDSMDPREGGVYSYRASAQDGTLLVTGVLDIDYGTDADGDGTVAISGTWNTTQADGEAEVGPQLGEGTLTGSVDESGAVWINLNPHWADNNVFLSGAFTGEPFEDIEGTWSYSTFVGPVAQGTFTAERR